MESQPLTARRLSWADQNAAPLASDIVEPPPEPHHDEDDDDDDRPGVRTLEMGLLMQGFHYRAAVELPSNGQLVEVVGPLPDGIDILVKDEGSPEHPAALWIEAELKQLGLFHHGFLVRITGGEFEEVVVNLKACVMGPREGRPSRVHENVELIRALAPQEKQVPEPQVPPSLTAGLPDRFAVAFFFGANSLGTIMAPSPKGLCCLLLLQLKAMEVPINSPFQVVRPTTNHSSMLPVPDGLARLASHPSSISIISVVGPFHSGKSFLLNALLGDTKVFSIGRKTSPETMGIWLCRTNMVASDGSEVWLMDSEGFFGPGIAESYDAKIFTIATLLGGHLVYNTVKVIDQQAVNLLEMLARRAQLFRTRTSTEPANLVTPEFLSVKSFPPLTWVVEDFVQEMPDSVAHAADPATAWLRSYLSYVNDSSGDEVHILSRLYSDVKVKTLFLPATTKSDLQDLSKLEWQKLTTEFKQELGDLKKHILASLHARSFEGEPMTGRTLERSLRFIVQGLQRGKFHELPSLWVTWTQQVAEMALQDADGWFLSLLGSIDHDEDPLPLRDFNNQVEDARTKSVQFYMELLKDFDVSPDIPELRKRMSVHFQQKLGLYHERVQRWVGELIAKEKDGFSKLLSQRELPFDPDVFRKKGEDAIRKLVDDFNAKLQVFSSRGKQPVHGKTAQMPVITQDPASQLSTDLHTLLSARELENEREIAQYFKAAVAAAEEAVDRELKVIGNKLVGMAQMKELYSIVQSRCWQAFEDKLAGHKWMKLLHHHKTHKSLVQTDTYENKMARFNAANDQRLSAHFRTALERCRSSYKTRKTNMAMPVSESDLVAEHRQLAASVRELLDEQGRDLQDTDAYRGALRSLETVLEEGFAQIKQKNVELWKVHSDEATRCALRENEAVHKNCRYVCLFTWVPMVHKAKSRKHLLNCLSRSGTGTRMSQSMQNQVFEDWYNKDLAHDAATVWTNFCLFLGTPIIGRNLDMCV